jgi:cytoskeleton protein RodZ
VVAPPQTAVPSPAADAAPANIDASEQQPSALPPPAAGAKTPATNFARGGATPLSTTSPTAQSASNVPPPAQNSPVITQAPGAPQLGAAVPAVGVGQVYGTVNRNSRVVLRARGDTRITVKGPDGQILLNRDLKSGDSYQVPDMPGVTLAASDAGAVEVDLDGIALGRAGQAQQVVGRVSLDAQSLADRFNNH